MSPNFTSDKPPVHDGQNIRERYSKNSAEGTLKERTC